MNLTLKVWRQKNKKDKGQFETYTVSGISSEMSFLEMFDVLNERLVHEGKEPIAFDHDCREGICGMCSMYINGRPHGPGRERPPASCICGRSRTAIPSWSNPGGPMLSRSSRTWSSTAPPLTASSRPAAISPSIRGMPWTPMRSPSKKIRRTPLLPPRPVSAAAPVWRPAKTARHCSSCRAKVSHLALLPQGAPERKTRVVDMIAQMDKEGFGSCTATGACEAVCPKEISITNIARLNAEYGVPGLTVR